MKQLLQHYKGIKAKANPNNTTVFTKRCIGDNIPDYIDKSEARKYTENGVWGYKWEEECVLNDEYLAEYQKQQLEIETLLCSYWDNNVLLPGDIKEPLSKIKYWEIPMWFQWTRKMLFNEWLDEELSKLD